MGSIKKTILIGGKFLKFPFPHANAFADFPCRSLPEPNGIIVGARFGRVTSPYVMLCAAGAETCRDREGAWGITFPERPEISVATIFIQRL
jgi:hypothetical protein